MERNLTTGSVFKNLILFSLPYLLSYFWQTLYGMADLFIIGQYDGVASTTAVSIGSQIMHMITVIIVGLAMGTTVSVGHAIGARNTGEAATVIGNSVTLFMTVAVGLMGILIFSVRDIVNLINKPSEAIEGTVNYLIICFVGIPFITAYNIISAIFRGLGDSKSPMYFIGIACAANIALDYLFIGVMNMGASGAALGTVLAQTLSVIISLAVIKRRTSDIRLRIEDFIPRHDIMGRILKVGVPVAVQDGCIQIAFIIITIIANRRGLNDAAAVGIVEKIISAVFIVPSSMLASVSALAAQNIGAGKHDRADKTLRYATMITTIYGVIVAVIMQFVSAWAVGIFTADAVVIVLGSQYIKGYIWDCIFAGIHFSFSGYFCAYGKSYIGFVHNILSIVLVRVPGSYLASKLYADTLFPMGLAAPAGSVLSVIICVGAYIWMKRHSRLQKSVYL